MFDLSFNFIKKIKRNLFPFYKDKRLKFVFKTLQEGFAEDIVVARFVGGCVRKHLTNDIIDDIDIATILSTSEIKEKFKNSNFTVIDTGIKHGTITLISGQLKLELTTLRKDINTEKGCYFSRMSGSGSVCYGLFNNESNAKKALIKIKAKHPKFWFSIAKTV